MKFRRLAEQLKIDHPDKSMCALTARSQSRIINIRSSSFASLVGEAYQVEYRGERDGAKHDKSKVIKAREACEDTVLI